MHPAAALLKETIGTVDDAQTEISLEKPPEDKMLLLAIAPCAKKTMGNLGSQRLAGKLRDKLNLQDRPQQYVEDRERELEGVGEQETFDEELGLEIEREIERGLEIEREIESYPS